MSNVIERWVFSRGALRFSRHMGVLHGTPSGITLDQSRSELVNWPEALRLGGFFNGGVDQGFGTVKVPVDGAYRVTAFILGKSASNRQNETIELEMKIQDAGSLDGDHRVGICDVATNQTRRRTISSEFIIELPKGAQLNLQMSVTGNQSFGDFTFDRTTFSVEFLALA